MEFRAVKADDGDLLEVEDQSGELITIELQRGRGTSARQHATPLPAEVRTNFAREPAFRKEDRTKLSPQSTAAETEAAQEAIWMWTLTNRLATSENPRMLLLRPLKAQVGPPDGFQPQHNAGGGNCLF